MPFLYKITNLQNQKAYIGWTKKSVEKRWDTHKKAALKESKNRKFYNAIKKYGTENWKVEILLEVATVEEAKQKEKEFIRIYNTYNTGYNSTLGGDGVIGLPQTEEANRKRSIALKGIKRPRNWNRHRSHSEQTKQKISASHRGSKKPWVKWTEAQIKQRGMTRRALTKEQYDSIQKLRAEGKLIKDVAKEVGVSFDVAGIWSRKKW